MCEFGAELSKIKLYDFNQTSALREDFIQKIIRNLHNIFTALNVIDLIKRIDSKKFNSNKTSDCSGGLCKSKKGFSLKYLKNIDYGTQESI